MNPPRTVSALLVSALVLAGVAATGSHASAARAPTPGITDWHPCADRPDVQCGSVRVPLDWSRPHGPTISLAVARNPVEDPARRVGALFVNPGGPSGFGVLFAQYADQIFSPELAKRFDLIGIDARGFGESTPIHCPGTMFPADHTLFPRDEAEFRGFLRTNREFGRGCLEGTGPLLGHVDTVSVARDHEAVRVALGEPSFNWLGLSYGTQIGMQYANLFPGRVRAMVYDAVLDHSMGTERMLLDEAATVEDSFNRFARWCRTTPECALYGRDVGALYDRLAAGADRHPMPVPGAIRPVIGEDIRLLTQDYLLDVQPSFLRPVSGWIRLGQALSNALAGDASGFALPAGEQPDGNQPAGVACMDNPSDLRTYADMRRLMAKARVVAPHTRGASQAWTLLHCMGWPLPGTNPPRRLDIRGTPPILLVNATHDASTTYKWAHQVRSQIRGSVLLTRIGDGHTSSMNNPCVRDAIDRYLIDGALPGPVCR
jgi:pimeloyl-ACP methyl ester carboxylesterase